MTCNSNKCTHYGEYIEQIYSIGEPLPASCQHCRRHYDDKYIAIGYKSDYHLPSDEEVL